MSKIVLFVLDLETGRPGAGVEASVSFLTSSLQYELIHNSITRKDGCFTTHIASHSQFPTPEFRVLVQAGDYFKAHNKVTFYSEICIDICWDGEQDMVLPLLLSSHGYTTYRGN
ncbi:MAG: 5-hydroxyisourate hydrolase [Lysobacterales bacterium]|jgi:5-hydroxyisourate hydrolase